MWWPPGSIFLLKSGGLGRRVAVELGPSGGDEGQDELSLGRRQVAEPNYSGLGSPTDGCAKATTLLRGERPGWDLGTQRNTSTITHDLSKARRSGKSP